MKNMKNVLPTGPHGSCVSMLKLAVKEKKSHTLKAKQHLRGKFLHFMVVMQCKIAQEMVSRIQTSIRCTDKASVGKQ